MKKSHINSLIALLIGVFLPVYCQALEQESTSSTDTEERKFINIAVTVDKELVAEQTEDDNYLQKASTDGLSFITTSNSETVQHTTNNNDFKQNNKIINKTDKTNRISYENLESFTFNTSSNRTKIVEKREIEREKNTEETKKFIDEPHKKLKDEKSLNGYENMLTKEKEPLEDYSDSSRSFRENGDDTKSKEINIFNQGYQPVKQKEVIIKDPVVNKAKCRTEERLEKVVPEIIFKDVDIDKDDEPNSKKLENMLKVVDCILSEAGPCISKELGLGKRSKSINLLLPSNEDKMKANVLAIANCVADILKAHTQNCCITLPKDLHIFLTWLLYGDENHNCKSPIDDNTKPKPSYLFRQSSYANQIEGSMKPHQPPQKSQVLIEAAMNPNMNNNYPELNINKPKKNIILVQKYPHSMANVREDINNNGIYDNNDPYSLVEQPKKSLNADTSEYQYLRKTPLVQSNIYRSLRNSKLNTQKENNKYDKEKIIGVEPKISVNLLNTQYQDSSKAGITNQDYPEENNKHHTNNYITDMAGAFNIGLPGSQQENIHETDTNQKNSYSNENKKLFTEEISKLINHESPLISSQFSVDTNLSKSEDRQTQINNFFKAEEFNSDLKDKINPINNNNYKETDLSLTNNNITNKSNKNDSNQHYDNSIKNIIKRDVSKKIKRHLEREERSERRKRRRRKKKKINNSHYIFSNKSTPINSNGSYVFLIESVIPNAPWPAQYTNSKNVTLIDLNQLNNTLLTNTENQFDGSLQDSNQTNNTLDNYFNVHESLAALGLDSDKHTTDNTIGKKRLKQKQLNVNFKKRKHKNRKHKRINQDNFEYIQNNEESINNFINSENKNNEKNCQILNNLNVSTIRTITNINGETESNEQISRTDPMEGRVRKKKKKHKSQKQYKQEHYQQSSIEEPILDYIFDNNIHPKVKFTVSQMKKYNNIIKNDVINNINFDQSKNEYKMKCNDQITQKQYNQDNNHSNYINNKDKEYADKFITNTENNNTLDHNLKKIKNLLEINKASRSESSSYNKPIHNNLTQNKIEVICTTEKQYSHPIQDQFMLKGIHLNKTHNIYEIENDAKQIKFDDKSIYQSTKTQQLTKEEDKINNKKIDTLRNDKSGILKKNQDTKSYNGSQREDHFEMYQLNLRHKDNANHQNIEEIEKVNPKIFQVINDFFNQSKQDLSTVNLNKEMVIKISNILKDSNKNSSNRDHFNDLACQELKSILTDTEKARLMQKVKSEANIVKNRNQTKDDLSESLTQQMVSIISDIAKWTDKMSKKHESNESIQQYAQDPNCSSRQTSKEEEMTGKIFAPTQSNEIISENVKKSKPDTSEQNAKQKIKHSGNNTLELLNKNNTSNFTNKSHQEEQQTNHNNITSEKNTKDKNISTANQQIKIKTTSTTDVKTKNKLVKVIDTVNALKNAINKDKKYNSTSEVVKTNENKEPIQNKNSTKINLLTVPKTTESIVNETIKLVLKSDVVTGTQNPTTENTVNVNKNNSTKNETKGFSNIKHNNIQNETNEINNTAKENISKYMDLENNYIDSSDQEYKGVMSEQKRKDNQDKNETISTINNQSILEHNNNQKVKSKTYNDNNKKNNSVENNQTKISLNCDRTYLDKGCHCNIGKKKLLHHCLKDKNSLTSKKTGKNANETNYIDVTKNNTKLEINKIMKKSNEENKTKSSEVEIIGNNTITKNKKLCHNKTLELNNLIKINNNEIKHINNEGNKTLSIASNTQNIKLNYANNGNNDKTKKEYDSKTNKDKRKNSTNNEEIETNMKEQVNNTHTVGIHEMNNKELNCLQKKTVNSHTTELIERQNCEDKEKQHNNNKAIEINRKQIDESKISKNIVSGSSLKRNEESGVDDENMYDDYYNNKEDTLGENMDDFLEKDISDDDLWNDDTEVLDNGRHDLIRRNNQNANPYYSLNKPLNKTAASQLLSNYYYDLSKKPSTDLYSSINYVQERNNNHDNISQMLNQIDLNDRVNIKSNNNYTFFNNDVYLLCTTQPNKHLQDIFNNTFITFSYKPPESEENEITTDVSPIFNIKKSKIRYFDLKQNPNLNPNRFYTPMPINNLADEETIKKNTDS